MSRHSLIESFARNGRTIEIHLDDDPQNPRKEWSNTATFVCAHGRYNLGDEQGEPCDEAELRERISDILVVMPLYLYDHSGLTISTSAFGDRWDSGQVGWAYVTKSALDEGGWKTQPSDEELQKLIESEVSEYDDYLRGNVYGYVVKGADGDHLDSCWGFIGDLSYVREEAIQACDGADDPADDRKAEELAGRVTYAAGDVP
jgi:hypothetical protein